MYQCKVCGKSAEVLPWFPGQGYMHRECLDPEYPKRHPFDYNASIRVESNMWRNARRRCDQRKRAARAVKLAPVQR